MTLRFTAVVALAAAVPALAQSERRPFGADYQGERLAPFVPSPQPVVERMLSDAGLKAGETVYDLGCGDGRIPITAARQFGAKGVCIEISSELVKQARDAVKRAGLENHVTVIHGNLMDVDLRPADVVTLYLLTESNDKLKPKLEKSLKPGARVVSHDFQVRGWKPYEIDEVKNTGREHKIYVYLMPPRKD